MASPSSGSPSSSTSFSSTVSPIISRSCSFVTRAALLMGCDTGASRDGQGAGPAQSPTGREKEEGLGARDSY